MTRKLSIFLLALVLIPTLLSAQQNVILKATGEVVDAKTGVIVDGHEVKALEVDKAAIKDYYTENNNLTDLDAILNYTLPAAGNSNFGFFDQDRMIQWFIAPADMIINQAGYNCSENDPEQIVELKLVKFAWTEAQLNEYLYEADGSMKAAHQLGYYIATGNGFNDWTGFSGDPDYAGEGWFDLTGTGQAEPFGEDLWSDDGFGAPTTPVDQGAVNSYQWVDMELLDEKPTVLKGEVIGVAMKNLGADFNTNRVGFLANNTLGYPAMKFYVNGRTDGDLSTAGWWVRQFTWDFALDVTLTGDIAPVISDMDVLPTTLSQDPREVTATIIDENPSGGNAGVASATLHYSVDGGDMQEVAMTNTEGDTWSGSLPGSAPGQSTTYYISAVDVEGNGSNNATAQVTYSIYLPSEGQKDLVIWNTTMPNYSGFYFQNGIDPANFDFDIWAFGAVTMELLENYDNVIENTQLGPDAINNDVIREWLAGSSTRNYFIWGDEWLGSQTNWENREYAEGDFHYDILGITADFNDIHDGNDAETTWSVVLPVEGTLIGGPLKALYDQVSADSGYTAAMEVDIDAMFGDGANWLDGVTFTDDVEVFLQAIGDDGETYDNAGTRILPAGNKIAFMATDPLALQSDYSGDGSQSYWYGVEEVSPSNAVAYWFNFTTDVRTLNEETLPNKFELAQNYPNPFNPTTNIKFAIPNNSNVSLKVFDVLGREITTLLNKDMSAGSYEVNFDASQLAAGMYIYQLKAGNSVSAKKMMLLK